MITTTRTDVSERTMSVDEVAQASGLSKNTLKSYITKGRIPSPIDGFSYNHFNSTARWYESSIREWLRSRIEKYGDVRSAQGAPMGNTNNCCKHVTQKPKAEKPEAVPETTPEPIIAKEPVSSILEEKMKELTARNIHLENMIREMLDKQNQLQEQEPTQGFKPTTDGITFCESLTRVIEDHNLPYFQGALLMAVGKAIATETKESYDTIITKAQERKARCVR